MPAPTPPVRKRRSSDNVRAAQRRVKSGPPPGYHTGSPAPSGTLRKSQAPTAEPGPATHYQQPVSAPARGPQSVLGALPGVAGTTFTGETGVNQHQAGRPTASGLGGVDRIGKRFQVGFDRAGNIVHLYGNDVPADQRRQVIKRK